MKKLHKRYDLTQCALYKCSNKRRLERLLFLEKYELDKLRKIVSYYSFTRIKEDGSSRKISVPRARLKIMQRRLLKLLSPIIRPEWVISSERGKSYIDNGKYHQENYYFLTMDIKKFYDSCEREAVYLFFHKELKIERDVAAILTNLVTFEKGIPTGCPTSQLIAYYAYMDMFAEINSIATKHGCLFTLYVDDMTFSSKVSFDPKKLTQEVDIILRKYGHRPKYSKVKYYSKKDHKLVTGVNITPNNEILVPNSLRYKIYINFQEIKQESIKYKKVREDTKKKLLKLKGQLQAAKSVENVIFPEISRLTNSISI